MKRSKDGHSYQCKLCARAYMRLIRSSDFVSSVSSREVVDGMKQCTFCKKWKPVSSFSKLNKTKSGLCYYCKDCASSYMKNRAKKRRLSGVMQNDGNRVCNSCGEGRDIKYFRILINGVGGRASRCKFCTGEKDRISSDTQNYYPDVSGEKTCSSCGELKNNSEFYRFKHHKDGLDSACKSCVQKRKVQYMRENTVARLRYQIRQRLRYYVHRGESLDKDNAILFLGCSLVELKKHLEDGFYPDPRTGESMSWDNYGRYGWHIDHIYPLSRANLLDDTEFKRVCHYTNLRPLWGWENLRKSSKIVSDMMSGAAGGF